MSEDILEGEEMSKDISSFGGGSTRLGARGAAKAEERVNTMTGERRMHRARNLIYI